MARWLDDAVREALIEAGFDDAGGAWVSGHARALLRTGSGSTIERVSLRAALRAARDGELPGDEVEARPVRFVVRPRDPLDRLGERLGLQTDGGALPGRWVEADGEHAIVARRLLADRAIAASLARLLDEGAARVGMDPTTGELFLTLEIAAAAPPAARLRSLADGLVEARDRMPRFQRLRGPAPPRPGPHEWVGLGLIVAALAGLLATGWASVDALARAGAAPRTLVAGAAASLGAVTMAYLGARGSSVGLRRFALVAIPGVIAALAWTLALAVGWDALG